MEIERGTTLLCDESRGKNVPDGHDKAIWSDHPRFKALVDRVQGDYIEATVSSSNDHPRTPEFGSELAVSKKSVAEKDVWSVE